MARLWSFVCALAVSVGSSGIAQADAASPTVTPATGGNGVPLVFGHAAFDLADVGYTQSEFFVEGTAAAYTPANPLTNDGKWTVAPFSPAAYKTRIVVNRPIDPDDFNGSVVVEWFNVSGGVGCQPGLATHARRADPRGLRLGGRLRPARRCESAQVRGSGLRLSGCRRSGALRVARASR